MDTVLGRAVALLLSTSALVGGADIAIAQQFQIESDSLLSGVDSIVNDNNVAPFPSISANGGVVVGTARNAGSNNDIPVAWLGGATTATILDALPGSHKGASVSAVSGNGRVIVGESGTPAGIVHAVMWNAGSANVIDLGSLSTQASSSVSAVSADGQVIVGDSEFIDGINRYFHAVKWVDGIANPIDLGLLDGLTSFALAVSANGNVIVGEAETASGGTHAVSWVNGSLVANDLGVLDGNDSTAVAVSDDGGVIVGNATVASGDYRAVAWKGGASAPLSLGTLSGANSFATAVSGNGSVVVGYAELASGNYHAVSWKGAVTTPTDLDTLGGAMSSAAAVSHDGSVIVGFAQTGAGDQHATAWLGGAVTPTDLGTLGGVASSATSVSANGDVIAGTATMGDGLSHVALWKVVKITPLDPDPDPAPTQPDPGSTPTPDPVVVPLDVTNTVQTVAALAHDTFSVIESQRATLGRLQTSCDVWKAGESCYSISTDIGKSGNTKDMLGWMTLGHAFTDNFSAGVSIAHSLWRDLPGDFDRDDNNIGGGLYARWRDQTANGSWYVQGSAAINRYDVKRTRRVLGYTEPGTGDSTVNGWGVQLEAGQSFDLANQSTVGYYGGLRYDDLKMDGYTETNAYFPFTYSDVKSQRSTAYLGANYGMALTDKVRWSVNAEIEQDLSHKDPSVVASADYIGTLKFDSDAAHTRGSLSTTVSYAFSDAVSVGVTPYVNRTVNKDTAFGAIIGLSGKF